MKQTFLSVFDSARATNHIAGCSNVFAFFITFFYWKALISHKHNS
jgi:hypothetical protein